MKGFLLGEDLSCPFLVISSIVLYYREYVTPILLHFNRFHVIELQQHWNL
jgi:hypothetical protein